MQPLRVSGNSNLRPRQKDFLLPLASPRTSQLERQPPNFCPCLLEILPVLQFRPNEFTEAGNCRDVRSILSPSNGWERV